MCSQSFFSGHGEGRARFRFGDGFFSDETSTTAGFGGMKQLYFTYVFTCVNMVEDRTKLYLGISFVAGILITLGFKDVYPDLERRYHQRRRRFSTTNPAAIQKVGQKLALKDNTDRPGSTVLLPYVEIPEGIEGCIGNTPLFKLKSLSDATGCEILVKAEVWV
jgi:hypothetical protein